MVFGGTTVLAESPPSSSERQTTFVSFVTENAVNLKREKLDILEKKFADLEAQVKQLLSEDSQDRKGLVKSPYDSEVVLKMQGWSSNDHKTEAEAFQANADTLEQKIGKLQARIDNFSQKPYFDNKGFKRSGLKILKGTLTRELNEAKQKIAWHQLQAKTLMISESNHQPRS